MAGAPEPGGPTCGSCSNTGSTLPKAEDACPSMLKDVCVRKLSRHACCRVHSCKIAARRVQRSKPSRSPIRAAACRVRGAHPRCASQGFGPGFARSFSRPLLPLIQLVSIHDIQVPEEASKNLAGARSGGGGGRGGNSAATLSWDSQPATWTPEIHMVFTSMREEKRRGERERAADGSCAGGGEGRASSTPSSNAQWQRIGQKPSTTDRATVTAQGLQGDCYRPRLAFPSFRRVALA